METYLMETRESTFIVDPIRDILIRVFYVGNSEHGRWIVTHYGHVLSFWI